jgi:hypothetical protein
MTITERVQRVPSVSRLPVMDCRVFVVRPVKRRPETVARVYHVLQVDARALRVNTI